MYILERDIAEDTQVVGYLNGEQIHRERSEVLLIDDLRKYLLNRYASEGLTPSEVDSIILPRNIFYTTDIRNRFAQNLIVELRSLMVRVIIDRSVCSNTEVPVSYTHLDVYKRQPLVRVMDGK